MRLNFSLVFLLAFTLNSLLLSSHVSAIADDALILDTELQDANSMAWPMLPGENLMDVARLFYPKNQAMQHHFISKTLRLNVNSQDLTSAKRFTTPTLLVIPTLKSLSFSKQTLNTSRKKPRKKKLQLSYDIGRAVEQVPAKLLQDYEWLVSKNVFLKEELAKLNKKIVFLQKKLNNLKLIFDNTLNLANTRLPSTVSTGKVSTSKITTSTATTSTGLPVASLPANSNPVKKVFKNLSNAKFDIDQVEKKSEVVETNTAQNIMLVILMAAVLLILGAWALKKYRQRMFASFSESIPEMDDTLLDFGLDSSRNFGGHWKDDAQALDQQTLQEIEQVIHATEAKTAPPKGMLIATAQNSSAKTIQPNIHPSVADTTMVEARLLMRINRHQDAIDLLKLTIEAKPKASINHWLYLLEIYRTLNLKEEFEQHAAGLKANFNVTMQAWDDSIAPAFLPQHLEEFPNIMEKLYPMWPGDEAKDYLRSLITDNRDGERAGFGKAALSEILLLIALLDTRKDFK